MPRALPPPDELLELLRTHPTRLAEVADGVTAKQLRRSRTPDEWSPVEILAHLRSCGDMWGGAIETILAEDHPTIRAINPRTWIDSTDYRELEWAPSFRAYRTQRRKLLRILESLPPKRWERAATVIGAGKPLELSVHRYADRLAVHERAHVKQIAAILGPSR